MVVSLKASWILYFTRNVNINITNTDNLYKIQGRRETDLNVTLYIMKGSSINQGFPMGVINAKTAIQLKCVLNKPLILHTTEPPINCCFVKFLIRTHDKFKAFAVHSFIFLK